MVRFLSLTLSVLYLGLTMCTLFSDVTMRDQVIALHSEIRTTMPPIAGVVQGSSMCKSLFYLYLMVFLPLGFFRHMEDID